MHVRNAQTHSSVPKLLYSRKEAAYALGISIRSIDYIIGSKRLPHRRLGKKVLVPHAALVAFSRADHPSLTS